MKPISRAPTDAPDAAEIEVSTFGPGVGESIVVHLGAGEWIVVDSLPRPHVLPRCGAALPRADRRGPAASVRAMIGHWDSDHIRGLGDLVEACPNAAFWCTAAIGGDKFGALLDIASAREDVLGLRLRKLAQVIEARSACLGAGHGTPKLAMESSLILERPARLTPGLRFFLSARPVARGCR
ncbi:MAG TPA: MBL fold metallo-hydrolase [Solirubrobacteraceae bacterium]|jgi:hypothetical protein|nr:MBL fold metallo-hydrolase [Solirubrobacteraceae bacterium]